MLSHKTMETKVAVKSKPSDKMIYKLNRLDYNVPASYSICEEANLVQTQSNQTVTTHDKPLTFIVNNSDGFVDAKKSYLRFTVTMTGVGTSDTDVNFGAGSVMNLIDTVTLTTASGTEVYRQEQVGRRLYHQLRWEKSQNWFDSVGSMIGCQRKSLTANEDVQTSDLFYFGTSGDPYFGKVVTASYCIPLYLLGGPFSQDQMLPPYLLSGASLQIGFDQDLKRTFQHAVGSNNGDIRISAYEMSDAVLQLQTCSLNRNAMNAIKKQSARDKGLQLIFNNWEANSEDTSSKKVYLNQTRSVVNALQSFVCTKTQANISDDSKDSYESEGKRVTSLFWKLGSTHWPQQPINDDLPRELFYNSLLAFEKQEDSKGSACVRYSDSKFHVWAQSLKASYSDYSGMPINLGRTLSLSLTFPDAVNRTHEYYFKYMAIARVYLDKTIIYD